LLGGGKVWPDGATLCVGHMHSPAGTTIGDEAFARIKSKIDAKLTERQGSGFSPSPGS